MIVKCDTTTARSVTREQEELAHKRLRSSSPAMPLNEDSGLASDLTRAVELLAEAFAAKSIRYALIGGLATLARG